MAAARASQGPLDAATARRLLDHGRAELDAGEPREALVDFRRVIGHPDPAITAEAWLGAGDALYRLDAEPQALGSWDAVIRLPETPSTYQAWRRIAGARVRANELPQALEAYRQADRRAPAEDKAEIASRLGWLSKELGQTRAAGRYFARSRGTGIPLGAAQLTVFITIAVSLIAFFQPDGFLYQLLWLDRADVQAGQLYRLLTVTLLHAPDPGFFWLHLASNMYALWLVGPIVEQIWGSRLFVAFYLMTAAAASTASFITNPGPAVGASGAIFGLLGVLLSGTRVHHPILDRRARAIVPRLGFLVILNLGIGFAAGGAIDNAAHIGGLLAGMWLGFMIPPGRAPTLRSAWQHPSGQPATSSPLLIAAGVALLFAVVFLGLAFGGAHL